MIKIIKKKINMSDELKTKIDWSCKFSKQKYKIYEGCLRIVQRTRELGYKIYSKNDTITICKDNEDKVRIEKAFGKEYSKNSISKRLYLSRQTVFKPISQKSIFEEYLKTNESHKGIYGLYLYYCYLLGIFPKRHPKQYLPYSIRKEITKLDEYSNQIIFMKKNNIETEEDLNNFSKNNYDEYKNLISKRENLWKQYHKIKTEGDKSKILSEINDIQPKIKELRKYDKYCKSIKERVKSIQININSFDKDIQKEKDNSRSM